MSDGANLIYRYDGSFEGLMCCVFESYAKNEIPSDILPPDAEQTVLLPEKEVVTDERKAGRVLSSIPPKMGAEAYDFVRRAFLTCLEQKELFILLFLRLGYKKGPAVMSMLTDDVVDTLRKAVRHLNNESHLLKGFIRFSVIRNILASEIEPKNYVLPLISRHFCERYPEECFLIRDKTHDMALIYAPHRFEIVPVDRSFTLPERDETERAYQDLWRLFYDTIEVPGRCNPKCRMSHMPKRYWRYMTEFEDSHSPRKPGGVSPENNRIAERGGKTAGMLLSNFTKTDR